MDNEIKVQIIQAPGTLGRDIYIFWRAGDHYELMTPAGIKQFKPGVALNEPTIHLPPEAIQALADALNNNGFKPQRGFIEGKLEATSSHLEDMRKLVFKTK